MREEFWSYVTMNGDEEQLVPFPEELIINETIPGHDTNAEIDRLLESKQSFDVNRTNDFGHTPLATASYIGSLRYVKLLVQLGADVRVKDSDGWTALHFAMATKQYDIAKFLMSVGAESTTPTNDGQKPLDLVQDKKVRIFLAKYGERCSMSNMKTSDC